LQYLFYIKIILIFEMMLLTRIANSRSVDIVGKHKLHLDLYYVFIILLKFQNLFSPLKLIINLPKKKEVSRILKIYSIKDILIFIECLKYLKGHMLVVYIMSLLFLNIYEFVIFLTNSRSRRRMTTN
jgi:hypothetical protein